MSNAKVSGDPRPKQQSTGLKRTLLSITQLTGNDIEIMLPSQQLQQETRLNKESHFGPKQTSSPFF